MALLPQAGQLAARRRREAKLLGVVRGELATLLFKPSTYLTAAGLPRGPLSDFELGSIWPALFTAVKPSKGETDPKKFQCAITFLMPAEADISALRDRVKVVFDENVPEKQRACLHRRRRPTPW
ncbi:hypothetical protein [Aquamicrobium terrae]